MLEKTVAHTPAGPGPAAAFTTLKVDQLHESKTNPRRHFDEVALAELTESVRARGVLMPILARPHEGGFEVVAGARRFRAASRAGLDSVPVRVCELTDAEALEIQVVENLQRADIHPLEEAEGYEQLMKLHGYTAEDLAAKVGKSKGYVYGRLKLCALGPEGRKAFHEGKLSPTTALFVARIPVPALQAEAVKEIEKGPGWGPRAGEPLTTTEAMQLVHDRFMLRLDGAGFSTTAADLVPGAGPCSTCPKRTGNQRELFADVRSADVCTDPVCFKAKREAAWERRSAEHRARGLEVVDDPKAAHKLLYGGGRYTDLRSDFYNPATRKHESWAKALGKTAADHVMLVRDSAGNVRELLPTDKALELAAAKGHTWAKQEHKTQVSLGNIASGQYRAQRQHADRVVLERRARAAIAAEVLKEVPPVLGTGDLRDLARGWYLEIWSENQKALPDLLGWQERPAQVKGGKHTPKQVLDGRARDVDFARRVDTLEGPELARVLVALALVREVNGVSFHSSEQPKRLLAFAQRFHVDAKAIRLRLAAEARGKAKKARPRKAAAAAAKRKAKSSGNPKTKAA